MRKGLDVDHSHCTLIDHMLGISVVKLIKNMEDMVEEKRVSAEHDDDDDDEGEASFIKPSHNKQ